jgi:hypothetical protein
MKQDFDERTAGQAAERKRIHRLNPTRIAVENDKRRPIALNPAPKELAGSLPASSMPVAEEKGSSPTPPPRVRKPSRIHDQVFAPTPDLEGHRAELRRVFGTLSDEFLQTMLGKLVAALRPNPFEGLDEAALNAAIALIDSLKPQNELEALLAVQIASVGFAADKMLRQSQQHLDEAHINVYGNYALKLFRVQLEMIETLDRHRRGNRQTVEVRHVHIHAGAQGVVGILNAERQEGGTEK